MSVTDATVPSGEEPVSVPETRFLTPVGKLEDDLVWPAIKLLDRSRLPAMIERWEEKERKGPGGRPRMAGPRWIGKFRSSRKILPIAGSVTHSETGTCGA